MSIANTIWQKYSNWNLPFIISLKHIFREFADLSADMCHRLDILQLPTITDVCACGVCCLLCTVYRVRAVCVLNTMAVAQCTVDIWECFPGFTSATTTSRQQQQWKSAQNGNPPKMETMKIWHFPIPTFHYGAPHTLGMQ